MSPPRSFQPTRVLLLGMMGSGKSSVGTALSQRTGWSFVDNDVLVERATGMTAKQLLAERGESAMREAESAALREAIAIAPPAIVATAAGTIMSPEDRAAIREGGLAVWLRAPAAALAARAVGAEHRPWLDRDPVEWFSRTIEERAPLYAEVADVEIDTSVMRPEQAAERIVGRLPPAR